VGLRATALTGLVLLCGCDLVFGPGPGPNAVADAPGPPGIDARLIDANFPDAAVDGDPTMDYDGDGVFDDVDNCRTIENPDQRDHDVDLTGDACDPCPHLHGADGSDIDGDLDLIGDGCDPRPGMAGDVVVGFYGFYDASEIADWTQFPDDDWGVVNNVLRLSTAPFGAVIELPVNETDVLVQMEVTPTMEPGGAGVVHVVGISVGRTSAQHHDCIAKKESGQLGALRYYGETVANGPLEQEVPWDGILVGADLRISALVHGMQTWCGVQTLPIGPSALLAVTNPIGQHTGAIAIGSSLLAIDVDYLFVVQRGP